MGNITLPPPAHKGDTSVEEAIAKRRSVRKFSNKEMSIEKISQLLWASQGITGTEWGYKFRAVPSAGALYPLEIYAVIQKGVYHYNPDKHELIQILEGDVKEALSNAAMRQDFIADAPLVLVVAAVFERTKSKYGDRSSRYVFAEAGHVSQNVYLECESLGLATVAVGAFNDEKVHDVLKIPKDHKPLYIMPVGYRK